MSSTETLPGRDHDPMLGVPGGELVRRGIDILGFRPEPEAVSHEQAGAIEVGIGARGPRQLAVMRPARAWWQREWKRISSAHLQPSSSRRGLALAGRLFRGPEWGRASSPSGLRLPARWGKASAPSLASLGDSSVSRGGPGPTEAWYYGLSPRRRPEMNDGRDCTRPPIGAS